VRHRRELKQLALGLLTVPPEKFDMNYWGKGTLNTRNKEFDCGFAGCAIGWMKKLVPRTKLQFDKLSYCPFLFVESREIRGFHAIAAYFEIDTIDARYLFGYESYKPAEICNPVVVANRILEYLEEHPQ
jgi:hypothetical protein